MNWLRQRREELGMSQDELAAQLQIEGLDASRSAVSAWEIGRNPLPLKDPDDRRALSKVLKLSEHEILRREGYPIFRSNRSEAAELGADIIEDLTPDKQRLAVRLLEQLREN